MAHTIVQQENVENTKETPWQVDFPNDDKVTQHKKKSLIAACRGNERRAVILDQFLHSASWKVENLHLPKGDPVTLIRSHDEILTRLARLSYTVSEHTLILDLDKLNEWGFVLSKKYGRSFTVQFAEIQEAINNPPPVEKKPRGKRASKPQEESCKSSTFDDALQLSNVELVRKVELLQDKVELLQKNLATLQEYVEHVQLSLMASGHSTSGFNGTNLDPTMYYCNRTSLTVREHASANADCETPPPLSEELIAAIDILTHLGHQISEPAYIRDTMLFEVLLPEREGYEAETLRVRFFTSDVLIDVAHEETGCPLDTPLKDWYASMETTGQTDSQSPLQDDALADGLTHPDNQPDANSYSQEVATDEQGADNGDRAPTLGDHGHRDHLSDCDFSAGCSLRERAVEHVAVVRPCDLNAALRDRGWGTDGSEMVNGGVFVSEPVPVDLGRDHSDQLPDHAHTGMQEGCPRTAPKVDAPVCVPDSARQLPDAGLCPAPLPEQVAPGTKQGQKPRKPRRKKVDLDSVEKVPPPPKPDEGTQWNARKVLAWGDYFRGYLLPVSERKGSRYQLAQDAAVRIIQRGISESTFVSVMRYMRGVVTATLENDPDFRDEWWSEHKEADVWHVEENLTEMVRKIKAKAEKKEKGTQEPARPTDKRRPYEAPVRLYGQAEAPPAGWYERMYGSKKPEVIGGRA